MKIEAKKIKVTGFRNGKHFDKIVNEPNHKGKSDMDIINEIKIWVNINYPNSTDLKFEIIN